VISLGFTLFFSGLIGWVGGASESPCLVRLFLFSVVISILAEIGGIISLNVIKTEVSNLATLPLTFETFDNTVVDSFQFMKTLTKLAKITNYAI
jgi:hypothetical protein